MACGAFSILAGGVALIGWLAGIDVLKSGIPDAVTMKVNAAIGFVLAGVSLLLQIDRSRPRSWRWTARLLAALVAIAGVLTIFQDVAGVDLGIDQLVARAPDEEPATASPGRMAPTTALSLAFIGIALAFLDGRSRFVRVASAPLVTGALIVGFLSLAGHFYGAHALYGVAGFTATAITSAAALVAIAVGTFAARPERGILPVLTGDTIASAGLRRMLPLIFFVPWTVGWLRLEGQRAGLFGTEFGVAIVVTSCTAILAAVALWNARLHQAAERALRESEQQFRVTVEAAPTGMLVIDGQGRIVLVNSQMEKLFGYERGELAGRPVEMLVPERFRQGHPELRAAYQRDPRSRPMGEGRDLSGVRKDGSELRIEIGLNPVRTSKGDLVLATAVDVTERQRAFEELRLAIDAAPTGMLVADQTGRILLVNAELEKLFGYPRDELLGQSIETLMPPRFRAGHAALVAGFFGSPQFRAMGMGRDLIAMRGDGSEFPVEIGLSLLQAPAGRFVLSSITDISKRRQAEAEREQLVLELRNLNSELETRVERRTAELSATLAERGILLQEIHHRVKNNLQVIGSLMSMQIREIGDAFARDALAECRSRVQAIALIHEQLYQARDYARIPFAQYVRSLAQGVLSLAGVVPGQVTLRSRIDDVAFTVEKAIPCGLILNELITNALKHAFPDGRRGTIDVEIRRIPPEHVILSVTDDGLGFAAPRDGLPSSMGMQLVSALVEQLDGRLEVSHVRGSRFIVTFPAT